MFAELQRSRAGPNFGLMSWAVTNFQRYCSLVIPFHYVNSKNEPVREKTNNLGSDQVRHKPDCTVTEDG